MSTIKDSYISNDTAVLFVPLGDMDLIATALMGMEEMVNRVVFQSHEEDVVAVLREAAMIKIKDIHNLRNAIEFLREQLRRKSNEQK